MQTEYFTIYIYIDLHHRYAVEHAIAVHRVLWFNHTSASHRPITYAFLTSIMFEGVGEVKEIIQRIP